MTELVLVRHGQASFGSDNYDQLSELGVRQACILGSHWEKLGWQFNRVRSGTLKRQVDTAMHALGLDASVLTEPAFNEYDSSVLLQCYADPENLKRNLRQEPKSFQKVLEQSLARWIKDTVASPEGSGLTSWSYFNEQITESLQLLMNAAKKDDRVVIFTSAGVIACILSQVMKLDSAGFLALNRRVFNASVTHINYGRTGFSLIGFNEVSALRLISPELVTYR